MACDPATIVNDARCIDKCIPPGMQLPVLISLFCQILAEGGGGGGGAPLVEGLLDPVAPPADPAQNSFYYSRAGGLFVWNVALQAWLPATRQVLHGTGAPGLIAPVNQQQAAIYIDDATGATYSWIVASQSWL